jgi:DNA mismatch repair ATPase MutS
MFGFQQFDMRNPRALFQGALTIFSIGQSIYQPIQNALHLQTVHAELMKKAVAIQEFVVLTKELFEKLGNSVQFKNPLQDIEQQDIHRVFATFWDEPAKLRLALCYIGDCEVVYRLAKCTSLVPAKFLQGKKPSLTIKEGKDPFLKSSKPYTLQLHGNSHHAILTGPNRGGKSSVLRSTLLSVVIAQTFGVGFCTGEGSIQLRPFDWIATGLKLEDRPGSVSMFESEVEFAIQILQRATAQPEKIGFVLFDELFHSTNPPDGARTADIFLEKLWIQANVASFISTHVFDLAKKARKQIQKLCVPAVLKKDGSLQFTYTLKSGICEVSSVDEILREKGLLCGNLDCGNLDSGKPETVGGNERIE